MAIVIRNGSNIAVSDVYRDHYGRILIVNDDKNGLKFVLTTIYFPNIDQLLTHFYIDLKNIFIDNNFESNENTIIGGDFKF